MSQSLIKVRQLSHSFNGHDVFKDFKFGLNKGDSVLLQGENGAGKTTLLKIISGLIAPNSGQFFLPGAEQSINYKAARKQLQNITIYLHQQPFLFDTSVRNNLTYAENSVTLMAQQDQDHLIRQLRLQTLLDQNAVNLSIGQKQRVALARSLIFNPAVLLLDEPFTAMDKESFSDTLKVLQDYVSRKGTLVVVSHQHDRSFELINNCWCIHPKGVLYCVSVD